MYSVIKSLANKNILITGSTGFVGKVLLEKILRDIPEIGKIFLLIRTNAEERFQEEILNSKIFGTLQSLRPIDFVEYINSKVVPITGDVLDDHLGFSREDLAMVQDEVNVIVHCAATVDFKERLDEATKKNVLGSLQLLEVAKGCRNLEAFIHVSTAYVNCDRQGHIMEELPPLTFNPEEMVQLILQMQPNELEKATPGIIGTYPNTYTFTKAMTERILEKRRGNIPMAFVRPTIIGASLREPEPGWIDSVSAVAAAILYSGVGVVHFLKGDHHVTADIVPIDSVVNVILGSIAATIGNDSLSIYHIGTSHLNPVKWYAIARWVSVYWRQHNVKKRVDQTPLRFRFYKSDLAYKTNYFVRRELPSMLYTAFANTVGTQQHKKNAEVLRKMTHSVASFTDAFSHFTSCHWIFDASNSEALMKRKLVEEEREKFYLGVQEIDWERYFRFFCYGLQRFVLHEDVKPPTELLKYDLVQEPRHIPDNNSSFLRKMFPDLTWAFSKEYHSNVGIDNFNTLRTPEETKDLIIRSNRVQDAIKVVAAEEGSSVAEIETRAHDVLDRMSHTMHLKIVRSVGWFLRKVWRRIYEGIHVEEQGIENIRKVLTNGPLILVPTHRSYIDFLIVSYIFYEYDLPLPHIAAGEDFLGIMFVNWVFRNCGAFFLRRSFKGDTLYVALFTEYVQRLIRDWSPVEFFIEGRRSRTGKSLHPKFGLLSMCLEPYLQKKVPDLTIVPISISYEKVIEAEIYTNELLGEQKTKESLNGLLRASKVLNLNFGRINVIFNEPISVREATDTFITQQQPLSIADSNNKNKQPIQRACDPFTNEEDKKKLSQALGYQISTELDKGLVITTTALVATILLINRKGISIEDLVSKVNWLREDITQRGGIVAYEGTTPDLVDSGLKLLQNVTSIVRNTYVPATNNETGKQNKSVLVLDFYRNQLMHLYAEDGIIAAALSSLQASTNNNGSVKRKDLIKEAKFLKDLLWLEFVTPPSNNVEEDINNALNSMIKRGILAESNNGIAAAHNNEGLIAFLSHFIWPLVDTYWVTAVSLFSLQANGGIKKRLLLQRIQWMIEKMHSEGKVSFYESCSMELLANTLDLFEHWKVVVLRPEDSKTPLTPMGAKRKRLRRERPPPPQNPVVALVSPYDKEAPLQAVIEHINLFRKPVPVYTGSASGLKHAMMTEFPIFAKL